MDLEDFYPITPETLRTRTEEELLFILYALPQGSVWHPWVSGEFAHRQTERLHESLTQVENAVFQVGLAVKALTLSSEHLEGLTKRLKTLTWALIFITILAGAVPIGIEIWKATREVPAQHSSTVPKGAFGDWRHVIYSPQKSSQCQTQHESCLPKPRSSVPLAVASESYAMRRDCLRNGWREPPTWIDQMLRGVRGAEESEP